MEQVKVPDLQKLGGAEGIRTPDPLHAMEVRYQLRYSPVNRIIWSRWTGTAYRLHPPTRTNRTAGHLTTVFRGRAALVWFCDPSATHSGLPTVSVK